MSDEPVPVRYSPTSGTLQQPALPLFTPDDVEFLEDVAQGKAGADPGDYPFARDLQARIQQWIDQQPKHIPGPFIRQDYNKPVYQDGQLASLIDDTDLTEEG